MKNQVTNQLFTPPEPGSDKTRVTMSMDDSAAVLISATLAIRQAGIPYSMVIEDEDENSGTPHAEISFQTEHRDTQVAQQNVIQATMSFPENPDMETVHFQANLNLEGGHEADINIRYTPEFQMEHSELSDLLHDAYYENSVNENYFHNWDDLKHEQGLFRERMNHLATRILHGGDAAFRDLLASHIGRFYPGAVGYPGSRVEIVTGDFRGTITTVFEPAGPGTTAVPK